LPGKRVRPVGYKVIDAAGSVESSECFARWRAEKCGSVSEM